MRAAGIFEFVEATPDIIDEKNIRGATIWAMRKASMRLAARLGGDVTAVFDGRDVPDDLGFPASSLIKGDTLVAEISAASIMAKVCRDNDMVRASTIYPGYGFEKHSGYGTKQHQAALSSLGMTEIHRSWAKKFC
jgi:ribonuclease HII